MPGLLGLLAKLFCLVNWLAGGPDRGHDWFNGGEVCKNCGKPRPQGWKP